MRELILQQIEKIKKQQQGFTREIWNDFMCGHLHISETPFSGMPDAVLLFTYEEIVILLSGHGIKTPPIQ